MFFQPLEITCAGRKILQQTADCGQKTSRCPALSGSEVIGSNTRSYQRVIPTWLAASATPRFARVRRVTKFDGGWNPLPRSGSFQSGQLRECKSHASGILFKNRDRFSFPARVEIFDGRTSPQGFTSMRITLSGRSTAWANSLKGTDVDTWAPG